MLDELYDFIMLLPIDLEIAVYRQKYDDSDFINSAEFIGLPFHCPIWLSKYLVVHTRQVVCGQRLNIYVKSKNQ